MQTPQLDLSLIVPCYNEGEHLRGSVKDFLRVLDRMDSDYEVVFVDDGSTDDTRSIVQEICREVPRCRYIFHERNSGRGAAFKTGFASSSGRVVGFIDADLEVRPHYIPPIVALIDDEGYDVVTGHRHYVLSQVRAMHRHVLSTGYRELTRRLLNLGLRDSETGCKFFKRETTTEVVLGSENDGWFWDTEVMARAVLTGRRVTEMPVVFRRRADKTSTVRVVPDSARYLVDLMRLRPRLGMSYRGKSPVYWTPAGYDRAMQLLLRSDHSRAYRAVAALIPPDASVVDVCCGTGQLARAFTDLDPARYLGLDFNGHFVRSLQMSGLRAQHVNVVTDAIPAADYVVMCMSFYHFIASQVDVFAKLRAAARRAVIICEPVQNLSRHRLRWLAKSSNLLTNPGVGDFGSRFNLASFHAFADQNGATEFIHHDGGKVATAVFEVGAERP